MSNIFLQKPSLVIKAPMLPAPKSGTGKPRPHLRAQAHGRWQAGPRPAARVWRWGLGFWGVGLWGLGFGVWGLGFGGLGFRVMEFGVWVYGVWGLGFRD